ncbi:hypothetical protein GWK47_037683 [Chionoecetes opilio]|uniref:Uncharacterized protein n=1 Tax=Chionoecetes opilio TaxID=41210 RepID=A0A8J5CZ61_CHIOP|nr:hypothetical protein GWK47_037683 [Chionoecetes opilio]
MPVSSSSSLTHIADSPTATVTIATVTRFLRRMTQVVHAGIRIEAASPVGRGLMGLQAQGDYQLRSRAPSTLAQIAALVSFSFQRWSYHLGFFYRDCQWWRASPFCPRHSPTFTGEELLQQVAPLRPSPTHHYLTSPARHGAVCVPSARTHLISPRYDASH